MSGTDWLRFPAERIGLPTFLKRNLIHTDLLAAVLRRARGAALEVGVGSGAQSALLSRVVRHVVTVDNDARMLGAARTNLERFGHAARPARPLFADAFALPFRAGAFGVALSQGLMEHFDEGDVARLVREQLRVCRAVVFSVPSHRYPRQDVGDERLLSPAAWLGMVERAVDAAGYRVHARHYRVDPQSFKYSLLARRPLGGFNVLVTIDPR